MTITARNIMTLRLSAAAGLMLIIAGMIGMMSMDQGGKTVTNVVYLLFTLSVVLAACAVGSQTRSRITRGVAFAVAAMIALVPVVEHMLTHPVSIFF